jgi:hypothetical protein
VRPTVVILLKEPRPGRVKTRLARDIGATVAAWWFRHQSARLIRRIGRDPRWRTVLCVSPATALHSRVWPADLLRRRQVQGDLGARMVHALRRAGRGPAVLVGADIPALDAGHIARAFACLRRADAVFGPAGDGGYWLIGVRRGELLPPGALCGVRWSGPDTLADSVATVRPLRVAFADCLQDVDTAEDLRSPLSGRTADPDA